MEKKDSPKTLGIYIHIPFCVKKCLYCDFLSAPAGLEEREQYTKALIQEILEEGESYVNYTVSSVFIGGGTPSLLSGENIEGILEALRKGYLMDKECEISMEVNPGTVTEEKLNAWHSAGINRLSIGLQSASDEELKALGRIHTSEDFFRTYALAVEAGFRNINVDLMSAIPGQTLESYGATLEKVLCLEPAPTHISAYSLILEEGTPFYENPPVLPDEDTEREMYHRTCNILAEHGYIQYEISNFAKPGFACRHNQIYWRRGNYAGFGIGAASLVDNVRFKNVSDIESYVNYYLYKKEDGENKGQGVKRDRQVLPKEEQMEEFMFLGLRMTKGVSTREFLALFGAPLEQVYPGIVEDFCKKGLLEREAEPETGDERIRLTRFGMDVSNVVMAGFIFP